MDVYPRETFAFCVELSNLELTLKCDRPRTRVDSVLKAAIFVMIGSINEHLGKLLITRLVSLKMYPTSWLSIDSARVKSRISLSAPPYEELVAFQTDSTIKELT